MVETALGLAPAASGASKTKANAMANMTVEEILNQLDSSSPTPTKDDTTGAADGASHDDGESKLMR